MRIVSAFTVSVGLACINCGHAFLATPVRPRQSTRRNAQLVDLSEVKSGREATEVLSNLATNGKVKLWNSARVLGGDRRVTKIELKMKTRIAGNVRSKIGSGSREVTDRFEAGLGVVLLMSTALALTAQASLPSSLGLVRFLIVLALVFAPYGFLVLGLNVPQEVNRSLVAIQRYFVPTFRRRQVIHEAGHFLVGYLLGVPIADYSVNSAVNAVQFFPLADPTQGSERARQMGFDVPVTSAQPVSETQPPQEVISWAERMKRDREASDQLPAKDDTRRVWPFRGIDHDSLDRLAIISLAGVMSELIEFGDGLGGFADLQQLRGFLNAASPKLDKRDKEYRIRWASVQSATLLQTHGGALYALADAMDRGASLSECIEAIETCPDPKGASEAFRLKQEEQREQSQKGFFDDLTKKKSKSEDASAPLIVEDDVYPLAVITTISFLAYALSGGINL